MVPGTGKGKIALGKGALYFRSISRLCPHAKIDFKTVKKLLGHSHQISLLRSLKEFSGGSRCGQGADCTGQGSSIFKEPI